MNGRFFASNGMFFLMNRLKFLFNLFISFTLAY